MRTLERIGRIITIQRVLIRYGADEILFATPMFRPFRYIFHLMPWNWVNKVEGPRAKRLRMVLEDLGPIYIKLGQILSTRRDILPEDIANEFAKLQDRVSPFPGEIARKSIEKTYGNKINEVFKEFDETPLASASIAQVHPATLHDGREFVVKVIRPGIEKLIRRDVGLLYMIATQAEKYYPEGKTLNFIGVVREFEKTLLNELDLMREVASASQLRRNFKDEEQFYVPEISWELSRSNLLVMERINGIQVSNVEELKKAGVDFKWLAEYGVEIFFTQVFRDNFFHADMHPGNIFVDKPSKDAKTIVKVVDFGIMSSLTEFDQRYLAENFIAFLNRDYHRVASLHIESGWVPADTRHDDFEFAIRTVCEPLLNRPMKEISFGELLERLFQTARKFNMVIMPQLILLQKTIINIEGIGRQLYPDLDLWKAARPQLERWMSERVGVKGLIKGAKDNVPYWIDRLPDLPNRALDIIDRLHDGKLELENKSNEIQELRKEMKSYNHKTIMAVIGSGLLMSAAIVYGLENEMTLLIGGIPFVSWVGAGVGSVLLYLSFWE